MRAVVLTVPGNKLTVPGNKLTLSISCRYGVLVYNGSIHYWHISRVLQREGLRCHLLPSEQTIVDAVRKLPDKQEWLSSLLLQLALGQLEVTGKADHSTTIASVQDTSGLLLLLLLQIQPLLHAICSIAPHCSQVQ